MATWSGFKYEQTSVLPPLPPRLMQAASKLKRISNNQLANAIVDGYCMGQTIAKVLSEHGGHDPDVVERLAEYVGLSPAVLYCFCDVYRVFDPSFIRQCQVRTTPRGDVITLDYLMELARLCNTEFRDALVEEFYATGMSVATLHDRIEAGGTVFRCA